MFKFVRRLLLGIVALFVILLLARNIIGGWIAKGAIQRLTGFQTHISQLSIRLTRPEIIARDVVVRNPPDAFREHRAMEINRIEAVYHPTAFAQRKLHFQKLILDIPQVVAVKNASGEINLKRLQSKAGASGQDTTSKESSRFQIDELVVSIGDVLYIDEKRMASQPKVFHMNVKNRVYRDIKSSEDIKRIIGNLMLERVPGDLLGLTTQALGEGIQTVNQAIGAVTNILEKGEGILNIFGGDK